MSRWDFRRGDRVLLRRLPPGFLDQPPQIQTVLDLCRNRELEVVGMTDLGLVEVDVESVARRELATSIRTVCVESECLELLDR